MLTASLDSIATNEALEVSRFTWWLSLWLYLIVSNPHFHLAESVPGCNGGTSDQTSDDFCIDPYELQSIPPQQDSLHHGSGSTFELKLYWQQGYMWQGESFERRWCMRCSSDNLACSPGHRVYLTNCDVDTLATKWQFNYISGSTFMVKDANSNTCLSVPNDLSQPIEVDTCNSGNDRQHFVAGSGGVATRGTPFELHPAWALEGCVGDEHHPKYGETLFVWKCTTSERWTTNQWNMY